MAKKKLKKYRVNASVVGYKYIGEIEATSKEEAEELIWDHPNCYVSMCHQCSGDCEGAEIGDLHIEEIKESPP